MGYEVLVHIVHPGHCMDDRGTFAMPIATVDLCKPGHRSRVCKLSNDPPRDPMTHTYLYSTDGDTVITHDLYDKRLSLIPIAEVIGALEQDAKNDDYRRFRIALKTLNAVYEDFGDDAKCILYGH